MSAETAFLEALKANPADDTTRLVYADWLDEHEQPAKAEYLRLTDVLIRSSGREGEVAEQSARLVALGESLAEEWRSTAGGRFDLIFLEHNVAHTVAAIKAVRDLTGAGLAEMKGFIHNLPQRVFGWLPYDSAVAFRHYLVTQIPSADVRIIPSDRSGSPHPNTYDLRVTFWLPAHPARDDPSIRMRAEQSFRNFLAASFVAPTIAEAARLEEEVSVATEVSPVALARHLADLRKRAAALCDATTWTFSIRVTPTR